MIQSPYKDISIVITIQLYKYENIPGNERIENKMNKLKGSG